MNPKLELFLVTYRRDFPYLEFALKSIARFATGFSGLRVLVPNEDVPDTLRLTQCGIPFPVNVHGYEEWPGLGMLMHMRHILYADQWCPEADFIGHMDADCVFIEPVTPADYIKDGRPYLRYEKFSQIVPRHNGVGIWQEVTQKCLPFPVLYETMRAHPGVFHHGLYAATRGAMVQKTGEPVDDYLKKQRNEYPQSFCEFVTLGNVAMQMFPGLYNLFEQTSDRPMPDNKLQQFWGHGSIGEPQDIWVKGRQMRVVPTEFIKALGLCDPPRWQATVSEIERMAQ